MVLERLLIYETTCCSVPTPLWDCVLMSRPTLVLIYEPGKRTEVMKKHDGKLLIFSSKSESQAARGQLFEKLSVEILSTFGYLISSRSRRNYSGMEIDIEGEHRLFKSPVFVECKFHKSLIDAPSLHRFAAKYRALHDQNHKAQGIFMAVPGLNSHAQAFYNDNLAGNASLNIAIMDESDVIDSILKFKSILSIDVIRNRLDRSLGRLDRWEILYTDLGLFWVQYVALPGQVTPSSLFVLDDQAVSLTPEQVSRLFELFRVDRSKFAVIDMTGKSTALHASMEAVAKVPVGEGNETTYFDEFLTDLRLTGSAKSTVKTYGHVIRLCESELGKPLLAATREEIESWCNGLKNKGLRAPSINRYQDTLRRFYKFALKRNLVLNDPTVTIERLKVDNAPVNVVTMDDLERIAESIGDSTVLQKRNTAIFATLMYTGMKGEEILSLNLSDLDLQSRNLSIRSVKRARVIPLNLALESKLRVWLEHHPTGKGPLFCDTRKRFLGNRLMYDGFRHIVNKCVKNAGLDVKRVTMNTIRNTVVRRLASNRNIRIDDAQRYLGYHSPGSVLRHSSETNVEHMRGLLD